jgi:hypothetical protein
MSIIVMPTTLVIGAGCGWEQRTYDISDVADDGSTQDRLGGEPRWALTLVQPEVLTRAEAGAWKALMMQLRGGVNRLQAWDPLNAAPRGTLSGSPSGTIAKGSSTLTLSGSGTVKQGDMLQLGTGYGTSQLFMVVADGAAGGSVTVEPPARLAFSGAAVTYTRASTYFRWSGERGGWRGTGSGGLLVQGITVQLLEAWT